MLNTPVRSINESISKNRKVSCGLSTRSPVSHVAMPLSLVQVISELYK